ncbi:hypothetical protein [Streptosporangium saharense]|uniref:Uncharacterized protein n=1 Tax=Streptosporangium saharense TaxID=1706840 RepID=A0A7W7QPU0_9ACTN|nr:hypothetical protein [Streptosporangium saharense]MBB4917463.1 hypothetical protein [Streptosporangium saharense]
MMPLEVMAGFGATGRIGPLRCGASLPDIAAVLGPPWDSSRISKRTRWPHLFAYGDIELCVCRCRLIISFSIQTWHNPIELLNPRTNTITSFPGHMTYRQITEALDATNCRWRPAPYQFPEGVYLQTIPSDVVFTFRADDKDELLLENAAASINPHDCPPIPIGAPDDSYGA